MAKNSTAKAPRNAPGTDGSKACAAQAQPTTEPQRDPRRNELELRTAEALDDIKVIGDLVCMAGESGHNPMENTLSLLGMMLMRLSEAASKAVSAEREVRA